MGRGWRRECCACAGTRRARWLARKQLSREILRLPQRSAGSSSGIFGLKRRRKSWILAMQACCLGVAIRKSQSAFTEGLAPLRSRQNREVLEHIHNSYGTRNKYKPATAKPQKRKSPAIAGLSCKSWRETRDSNPGDAINVRRFSRLLCKCRLAAALNAKRVPLLREMYRAGDRILQGVRF